MPSPLRAEIPKARAGAPRAERAPRRYPSPAPGPARRGRRLSPPAVRRGGMGRGLPPGPGGGMEKPFGSGTRRVFKENMEIHFFFFLNFKEFVKEWGAESSPAPGAG